MRGADAILGALEASGVELVLGYIGHTTQELADAARDHPGIRTMYPATELGGAHVINGYNFMKGRAAAAGIWHTCGTMLIPGGLYEGMFTRIPSIHLGLNVDAAFKDREAMQEMPNVEVLRELTRFATRVERPGKLAETVQRAAQRAHGTPSGPAFVDIPFDLTVDVARTDVALGWQPPSNRSGTTAQVVKDIAATLLAADRPAFIVGGGAVSSQAQDEVRELAELLGMPTTTTHTAQGILPESHALALGSTGPIGWRPANEWVAKADVVLAVGTRMSDWGWAQSYAADLPGQLIHVDLDPAQLGNFYFPSVGVVGDARTVLRQVIDEIQGSPTGAPRSFESREYYTEVSASKAAWLEELAERGRADTSPISPWRVAAAIEAVLDPEDVIVTDAGNNTAWIFQGTTAEHSKRLVTTFGAGVLGAGFPMALGVKLAVPDRNVVAAVGDGGFGYGTNEIAFALREGIALTVVVFNDGALGANNGFMTHLYGRPSWTTLNNPDFAALARAYGAEGERVEDPAQLEAAIQRGVDSGTVYVIDVPISQEFGYPSTGVGGVVRWAPREWPEDTIGTRMPGRFDAPPADPR
ncbi:thiamine pyrophosphate-binding protein [uncultured Arthrobacter sp.]|uniref:thiamine pyrophosphate-binding protein n=1 Tax=uncultured Arthrobacter sp. TaxID=114050 RepID=UPI0025F79103|nr:thiamine pyrophosphate-binding protein [uncultured Arthrobacter sp.]